MVVSINLIAIILAIVFVAYLVVTYLIFGFIGSISNSYYKYQNRFKTGIIFTLFMGFITICLIVIADIEGSNYSGFFFAAAGGSLFTGIAARYEEKITKTAHFLGASTLITFTAIGIGLSFENWVPLLLIIVSLILFIVLEILIKRTKHLITNDVYWFEVVCFILLIGGLLIE